MTRERDRLIETGSRITAWSQDAQNYFVSDRTNAKPRDNRRALKKRHIAMA
jgi:hypothetical protein